MDAPDGEVLGASHSAAPGKGSSAQNSERTERSRTPKKASSGQAKSGEFTKFEDSQSGCTIFRDLNDYSIFVVEACAGSAMLSAVLQQYGFEPLAIDFGGNKHRPYMHVVNLDLRQRHSWQFLEKIALSRRLFFFHGAPPCGTSSRARDRPMSQHQHGPKPLRSSRWPMGFPWLSGVDLERVESANQIYVQMAKFCKWLHTLNIMWSLGNPGNSYMWLIPEMVSLTALGFWVYFHSCCHGGDRKKFTAFLTSCIEFAGLESFCDNSHTHADWGMIRSEGKTVFATSKEAAYPRKLCERIAELLKMAAFRQQMDHMLNKTRIDKQIITRAATGKQPKTARWGPLVSEFKFVGQFSSTIVPVVDSKFCLVSDKDGFPAGSRVLNYRQGYSPHQRQPDESFDWKVGVFRTPEEFVNESKQLTHPFDSCRAVDDDVLRVVVATLKDGPVTIMKHRLQTLQQWKAWGSELAAAEDKLHRGMPEQRQKLMEGKKILLMKRIAENFKWPDMKLFDELVQGFAITGHLDASGIFPADAKPKEMDEQELMKKSKFLKPAIWAKQHNQPLQDFSDELWSITEEEAHDKCWLQGPFTWDELEHKFASSWIPVRRFAAWQRNKWRPIDDLSENGVNSAISCEERIDLRALDETVWLCRMLMNCTSETGTVDVEYSDGCRVHSDIHPYWKSSGAACQVVLKTVDLKAAYKQLPLAEKDEKFAVICIKNPKDGKTYGYVCKTLPFGAVGSVLHFNRFARFVKKVLLELKIMATNYFDDYPLVSLQALAKNTEQTVRYVMKLLGIHTAEDKELPFERKADMLGVTVDRKSSSGR